MKVMNKESRKMLRTLVGAPGFEPGASCAQGRRATRLRYAPTCTRNVLSDSKARGANSATVIR
jgi:hypothetical protein